MKALTFLKIIATRSRASLINDRLPFPPASCACYGPTDAVNVGSQSAPCASRDMKARLSKSRNRSNGSWFRQAGNGSFIKRLYWIKRQPLAMRSRWIRNGRRFGWKGLRRDLANSLPRDGAFRLDGQRCGTFGFGLCITSVYLAFGHRAMGARLVCRGMEQI